MEITEDQLRIARWRCHTIYRIPDDVVDDWLHHAIILALEKDNFRDDTGLPNWLSLVAYYKFLDDKYRLSTRKTRQFPVLYDGRGVEMEIDMPDNSPDPSDASLRKEEIEHAAREVKDLSRMLTPLEEQALHLLGRIDNGANIGRSLGRTTQAISMRLIKVKRKARENKSGDST